jgi:hypothetical protein
MTMIMTTMFDKSVEIVRGVAANVLKQSVARKSVDTMERRSQKHLPLKVDDHIRVALSHIALSHIALNHIALRGPDILTALASIDQNPIAKGLLIKGLQNMENSHHLHMIRKARADFVLR